MNTLEMQTYVEPNIDIVNEFINNDMTEKEKEEIRKKTIKFYDEMTDEDWRHLGDNY
jgi:hypothetical protein